jgi:hypothetical protein
MDLLFDDVSTQIERLPQMTLDELYEFEKLFNKFDSQVQHKLKNYKTPTGYVIVYSEKPIPYQPVDDMRKALNTRKKELLIETDPLAARYYSLFPVMSKEEVVNGYHLYDIPKDAPLFQFGTFKIMLDNQDGTPFMSDDELREWLEKHCCYDWNKIDFDGVAYAGGFWRSDPPDPDAFHKTRKMNIDALMALPFSRSIIMDSVDYGCKLRQECVRFSNFIGVWFERTLQLIKEN